MHDELHAVDLHNTWSIVKLPKEKKVVGFRWIYKSSTRMDRLKDIKRDW